MASRTYELQRVRLKHNDGSGEEHVFPLAYSAMSRAIKKVSADNIDRMMLTVLYSIEASGRESELGDIDLSQGGSDEERMYRVFDRYAAVVEDIDDDGNPVPKGEPDPTPPS